MKFWFITGSQDLYGEEVLKQVEEDSIKIVAGLNKYAGITYEIEFKGVVKDSDGILKVIKEANYQDECLGIITWMHTFSPSKMWIRGLSKLDKPYLHFHTQFNKELPYETIDMDFMNLNQSAHGDREHGYIGTRMHIPRSVVVGYWEEAKVKKKIQKWMQAAHAVSVSQKINIVRFGDNMRYVAVTDGDKVDAEIKLGWSVNTYAVGDLVKEVDAVSNDDVEAVLNSVKEKYIINTSNFEAIKYQIRIYIAIKKILVDGNFHGFTTTFEDLYGLEQLPGLACQMLMEDGYGFAGEGDWKTAAMTYLVKQITDKGTSFMEDYTYHFDTENLVLGAHMLEVCPSIANDKPKVSVNELGIGGKQPPARLIFEGKSGKAICISMIDLGNRFRVIVQDVEAITPIKQMPNLPVASLMWKPNPCLEVAAEAWILAGGAHHTTLTYGLDASQIKTWAENMGIECVCINKDTDINQFKMMLELSDMAWRFK